MHRFWRKNRRPPPPGSKCWGVDLNRNYDLGYGLGASTDPCQEVRPPHTGGCCSCVQVYQGPGPLSEPETAAMTGLGAGLNSSLLYYVSLHAYGQSWLTPWGFKTEPVASMDKLVEAARASFKEVRARGRVYPRVFLHIPPSVEVECEHGRVPAREYEVGGAADIYYVAGGASDDWMFAR